MNEAQAHSPNQVNRFFVGNSPQKPSPQPAKVMDGAISETARNRAEREINGLLRQFKGRYDLVDLLDVVKRRYSPDTVRVLLERIKNKWDRLPIEKQISVRRFEDGMKTDPKKPKAP